MASSSRPLRRLGLGAGVLLMLAAGPACSQAQVAAPRASAVASAEARQALAPSGKLRVGVYPGSPTSLLRDAAGQARGVTVDLGTELGRRLGVPVELVEFARVAQVVDALKSGAVDFSVTNATPARIADIDFTPPILAIEQGYLVPRGSPIASLAQVDQPGVVVGVTEGSSSLGALSRLLKNARIVTAPSLDAAAEMIASGKVQAYATNKAILFQLADRLPGARILDGVTGRETMGMAVPKGRPAALAYVSAFAADAVSSGLVDRAVGRAGLRGSVSP